MKREDLAAWKAQEPPDDFASKVLERVMREESMGEPKDEAPIVRASAPNTRLGSWVRAMTQNRLQALAAAACLVLALGAAQAWRQYGASGAAVASSRTEVHAGRRTLAVLEPGAEIRWDGDKIQQVHGDVFYRVEAGSSLVVHAGDADIEVMGTCFRVRIEGTTAGAQHSENRDSSDLGENGNGTMNKRDVMVAGAGAVAGAITLVGVYEGKVRLSHAGASRVELRAGESGRADRSGAHKTGARPDAMSAESRGESAELSSTEVANRNLVGTVSELNRRLEAVDSERKELQKKLLVAQHDAEVAAGKKPRDASRHEFDLSKDDWSTLAKDGTIKFRVPSFSGCTMSPERLQNIGLAQDDAPKMSDAYAKSSARMWSEIKPLCAKVLGGDDLAEKIGPDTCVHLVLDLSRKEDAAGASEAMRQVGEIRAGERPGPSADLEHNPVLRVFMALTEESDRFEHDLAESFGPDTAHRLVYDDHLCMSRSTFGGAGPRQP